MPDNNSVLGGVLETLKEEGGKTFKEVAKEVVKTPLNVLEGIAPTTPEEVKVKSEQAKMEQKAKLAKVRSELSSQLQTAPKQHEDRRLFQGAAIAERSQVNQNASMNNTGGQALSANMRPQKKLEPLVIQQKRKDKLIGAG